MQGYFEHACHAFHTAAQHACSTTQDNHAKLCIMSPTGSPLLRCNRVAGQQGSPAGRAPPLQQI